MFLNILCLCFAISFSCALIIILLSKRLNLFVDSADSYKPQRFHTSATPRAGGIGIFIAFIFAICYVCFVGIDISEFSIFEGLWCSFGLSNYLTHNFVDSIIFPLNKLIIWLACLSVIFLSGLIEDFSGRLSPKFRLIMQCLSAFMLCVLLEIVLLDLSLGFALPYLIGLFFTTFALVGVSNAINIIDGFNGLASGVCALVLIALGHVALMLGDYFIFYCSIVLLAGILGFFTLNFPFGKIFLGDGGAYFLGFVIGILLVLFTQSHSEVSAFFGLSLMIYPIFEVLFSIYRRKRLGNAATAPDSAHLHTLVFRILQSNVATSSILLLLNILIVAFSSCFYNNTFVLICWIFIFIVVYLIAYKILERKAMQ